MECIISNKNVGGVQNRGVSCKRCYTDTWSRKGVCGLSSIVSIIYSQKLMTVSRYKFSAYIPNFYLIFFLYGYVLTLRTISIRFTIIDVFSIIGVGKNSWVPTIFNVHLMYNRVLCNTHTLTLSDLRVSG